MKTSIFLFVAMLAMVAAFVPVTVPKATKNTLVVHALPPMMPMDQAPSTANVEHVLMTQSNTMYDQTPVVSSSRLGNYAQSSLQVAIQEYRKPTAEEIAAKKRNFNLWFWGGGFVAPFLATFYYFGFKFWER
mmetsp:Transcript_17470/g.25847  ORF Transcript_17470/g.25847 Transcript_17470/m.25847 type:complete len:132 (-) Transcript_17470:178-573(-)